MPKASFWLQKDFQLSLSAPNPASPFVENLSLSVGSEAVKSPGIMRKDFIFRFDGESRVLPQLLDIFGKLSVPVWEIGSIHEVLVSQVINGLG